MKKFSVYIKFGINFDFNFSNNYPYVKDNYDYRDTSNLIHRVDFKLTTEEISQYKISEIDLNNSVDVFKHFLKYPNNADEFSMSYKIKYNDNSMGDCFISAGLINIIPIFTKQFMSIFNLNYEYCSEKEYLDDCNHIAQNANRLRLDKDIDFVADVLVKHSINKISHLALDSMIYVKKLDDNCLIPMNQHPQYGSPIVLTPVIGRDDPFLTRVVKIGNILLFDYIKGQRSITSCSTLNLHYMNNLVELSDFRQGVFLKNRLKAIMQISRVSILNISSQMKNYDRVHNPILIGDLKSASIKNIRNKNSGNEVFSTLLH